MLVSKTNSALARAGDPSSTAKAADVGKQHLYLHIKEAGRLFTEFVQSLFWSQTKMKHFVNIIYCKTIHTLHITFNFVALLYGNWKSTWTEWLHQFYTFNLLFRSHTSMCMLFERCFGYYVTCFFYCLVNVLARPWEYIFGYHLQEAF